MAMIKCPECGKEISDLAEKCPNCGFPIGFRSSQNIPPNNVSYQQPVVVNAYSPKKSSTLGILALIFSMFGCTFIVGIVLAIIDLCKKDGKKKGLSIAALIISFVWLMLIWLAIGIDSYDSSVSDSSKNTNIQVAAEKEAKDTEKSEQEIEKEAVKDTDVNKEEEKTTETDDTKKEESKDKYYVGDTWQNKYVLVSFDKCGEYISDNQFIQPNDGNKYVYATFTFENVGTSDTTVSYWDFDCYADGYACEGTYGADDAAFSQTLSSGRKITGSVYYEVPENATEIEFEFSPNFWTSEKIVFVYK